MTQEDKDTLLKYLCMVLPYGVMVNVEGYDTEKLIGIENETITTKATSTSYSDKGEYPIDIVKPYLRTMSSMTDDEQHEYNTIAMHTIVTSKGFVHIEATDLIDWLNAHHFDYRGLIVKGLALEAPDGMY